MVVLDTSVWIEFFRRNGDLRVKVAVKALLDEYEAALCGPVEMEFLGGAHPHERSRIQAAFDIIPYVPNDQKIWRKAALTYADLRSTGLTVPWNDVLIATIVLESDFRVYTADKHFTAIAKRLPLRLYEPGYNGGYAPE